MFITVGSIKKALLYKNIRDIPHIDNIRLWGQFSIWWFMHLSGCSQRGLLVMVLTGFPPIQT